MMRATGWVLGAILGVLGGLGTTNANPFITIALSDIPVPGITASASGGIQNGGTQINNRGQILFKSYPGPTTLSRFTPGVGVETMAVTGTPATGVPDRQIIIGASTTAGMRLQEDGDVTFYAQLNGISNPNIFSRRSVYEARGTGAGVQVNPVAVSPDVIDTGVPASPWISFQNTPEVAIDGTLAEIPIQPFGQPALPVRPFGTYKNRTFTSLHIPDANLGIPNDNFRINDKGTVAFLAPSPIGPQLIRIKHGGPLEVIATGGTFGTFDLNENDELAWLQLIGGEGKVLKTNGAVVEELRNFGGMSPQTLTQGLFLDLSDGDDVAVYSPFSGFIGINDDIDFTPGGFIETININTAGDVAIYDGTGIDIFSQGAVTNIVEAGDVIEVLPNDFRTVSQVLVSSFRTRMTDSPFFNDSGDVVFDVVFNQRPGDLGPTTGVLLAGGTPVPLPASAWMLLAGCLGVWAFGRFKHR